MAKKYLILTLTLIIVFMGFRAEAQIRDTDVVLSLTPEFPVPNQNVNAILSSHTVKLDKTNISWFVNGEELNRGIGKKSFSFRTGEAGSSTVLSVAIDTIDGQSISKKMTLTPGDLDMLWEAYDAYAPPFYKGKVLTPIQGTFKVVAMPNLTNQSGKVNINNLSYVWTKDGKIQSDSSGWGKSYFILQNSYLDEENTVKVTVSNISGEANTSGKIILKTTSPKILFYENDPALGVKLERALNDGFRIGSNGKTLAVEPYFFSPKDINSEDLVFDWFLNNEKIQTPSPKNTLSVKPDAGQSGNATIKVVINNINTLFQSLEKQISVSF